jgi:hypothetical protein
VEHQEIRASEMWAKMNCNVLTGITERELDDRNHFSRMLANLEKKHKG